MKQLATFDAHSHLAADHSLDDLANSGFVLAMTLSLEEAEKVIERQDAQI